MQRLGVASTELIRSDVETTDRERRTPGQLLDRERTTEVRAARSVRARELHLVPRIVLHLRVAHAGRVRHAAHHRLIIGSREEQLPPRRVIDVVDGDRDASEGIHVSLEGESVRNLVVRPAADRITRRGVDDQLREVLRRSDVRRHETAEREQQVQVPHGITSV